MDPQVTTSTRVPTHDHVVLTPGTCGGKPRIDGTRIRVQDVMIWHERMGRSAEEIVRDFPQLSLAQVYSALAYYYDHRTEIDAHLQEDEQAVEAMKASIPPSSGDSPPIQSRHDARSSIPSRRTR